MARVVVCFVRHRGRVLLARGGETAGTDPDRWDGISGRIDDASGAPEADGRRVLRDAVGTAAAGFEFVRDGQPLDGGDESGAVAVVPVLFESDTGDVAVGGAFDAVEWVDPTRIRARKTVPWLRTAWRRVAPTVATVRADRIHGSAWIAARALETLRDAAAAADAWDDVVGVARDLRAARPEMAAVANGVDRAVATAGSPPIDPDALVDCAIDVRDEVLAAGDDAARAAADHLRGIDATAVATISRSGTVRAGLAALSPDRLVVAESRPEREGVGVAEWAAAETDATVTLTTEAGLPTALARDDIDAVLVGADAIAPGGDVVNKTGTRLLALAARDADVPVYVAASTFKIRPAGGDSADPTSEQPSSAEAVYDGDVDLSVHAPTFEAVAAELVDGVATEDGLLDTDAVRAVADAHADNAAWTG